MDNFPVALYISFTLASVAGHPTQLDQAQRYMWIPDGEARPHLVDLMETEPIPAIEPVKDVFLNVYTRKNPSIPQYIRIENHEVAATFDPSHETRIIIHGWNSAPKHLDHIRKEYVNDKTEDYNVILLDWSGPAGGLYSSAKARSKQVGEYLSEVITYLHHNKGVSPDKVQLVGHSLGAHLAGVTGHHLGGALAGITGLDPAGPLYGSEPLPGRLDNTDAQFVQVVHTCGGFLGWEDAMGHIDFYPNGGKSQPGCGMDFACSCSHSRSHYYFAESITTTVGFKSHECATWANYINGQCYNNAATTMGEKISSSSKGTFFLKTAKSAPYALG